MKKTNRIKINTNPTFTRQEIEGIVADIATAMNKRRQLMTEIDHQKLAIDQAYAGRLNLEDSVIEGGQNICFKWAEANPAEFTKRKSIDFPSGTIGFRTGTPKLKTLRKATWDAVLEIFVMGKRWATYIRIKQEVDKEKIITDHTAGLLTDADLNNVALKVVQEETFYVEPKLTTPETRATTPTTKAA